MKKQIIKVLKPEKRFYNGKWISNMGNGWYTFLLEDNEKLKVWCDWASDSDLEKWKVGDFIEFTSTKSINYGKLADDFLQENINLIPNGGTYERIRKFALEKYELNRSKYVKDNSSKVKFSLRILEKIVMEKWFSSLAEEILEKNFLPWPEKLLFKKGFGTMEECDQICRESFRSVYIFLYKSCNEKYKKSDAGNGVTKTIEIYDLDEIKYVSAEDCTKQLILKFSISDDEKLEIAFYAQQWVKAYFPNEESKKIKTISENKDANRILNKNYLQGHLDLAGFTNLEELVLFDHPLTSINLKIALT